MVLEGARSSPVRLRLLAATAPRHTTGVALALQENDRDMCKAVAAFRTAHVAQQVYMHAGTRTYAHMQTHAYLHTSTHTYMCAVAGRARCPVRARVRVHILRAHNSCK